MRNCRKRQIRLSQKLKCALHAASYQIIVRAHTFRLLERACKVRHRQARNAGEHLKANVIPQVGLDVFAYASEYAGRQATATLRAQLCEGDVSGFTRFDSENPGQSSSQRASGDAQNPTPRK